MKTLSSFVAGSWVKGSGKMAQLHNPATEDVVAETSTEGIDFQGAVEYARRTGGPALRELTFAARAELLRKMAKAIHGNREELLRLATINGGNTRGDAKFDVDGASATLAAYADYGEALGDNKILADGESIQVGRTARLSGQHIWTPRHGVAVHINAFNFPAWGTAEKAACSILAGVPVISKPATATSLVAHRMAEIFVEEAILPEGAFSFVCGGVGDMLSYLRGQDVLAFTGSSWTAAKLRALDATVKHSLHINVEADSLNAAVLAPDVKPGSDTWSLFIRDLVKDITQKTGQKCTAIRRIFVPEASLESVVEAVGERLSDIVVGNPAEKGIQMGPVATARQYADVREGIAQLCEETDAGFGGNGQVTPRGVPEGKGFFIGPILRICRNPHEAKFLNSQEVFGPVATVAPYSGEAKEAAMLVQKGDGGLVTSVYSDDRDYFSSIIPEIGPYHGRIYMGSAKVADQSMGPGTVLPSLLHGGPGRAGGGEELGGLRGLRAYQQRTALQGDKGILKALLS